jgi:hypothetical protein
MPIEKCRRGRDANSTGLSISFSHSLSLNWAKSLTHSSSIIAIGFQKKRAFSLESCPFLTFPPDSPGKDCPRRGTSLAAFTKRSGRVRREVPLWLRRGIDEPD